MLRSGKIYANDVDEVSMNNNRNTVTASGTGTSSGNSNSGKRVVEMDNHHGSEEEMTTTTTTTTMTAVGEDNRELVDTLSSSSSSSSSASSTSSLSAFVASSTNALVNNKIEVLSISASYIPLLLMILIPLMFPSMSSSSSSGDNAKDNDIYSLVSLHVFSLTLIIVLSTLISSKAIIYRPTIFWKIIIASIIMYNLLLTSLYIFPTRETARDLVFGKFFTDIGSLESYEKDTMEAIEHVMMSCTINATTLYRQMFVAPWFISHAIGWAVKMFVLRDVYICLFAAAMFEIWEVSLGYVVPEFEECWWDSLFLDFFVANLIGITIGYTLLKYNNLQMYNWTGYKLRNTTSPPTTSAAAPAIASTSTTTTATTEASKTKTTEEQKEKSVTDKSNNDDSDSTAASPPFPIYKFTPYLSSQYTYEIFNNQQVLFYFVVTAVSVCVTELNIFNVVNTMGTPHGTNYCFFRMFFIGFLALPVGCEWYYYTQGKLNQNKSKEKEDHESDNNEGSSNGINVQVGEGGGKGGLGLCTFVLIWMNMLELMVTHKFFPPHMQAALDTVNNSFNMPIEIVVAHVVSILLFMLWVMLRYKVVGSYDDNNIMNDINIEDMKVVNKILLKQQQQRKQSQKEKQLYDNVHDSVEDTAYECWCNFKQLPANLQSRIMTVTVGVDSFLLLATLPQCFLLYNGWKY